MPYIITTRQDVHGDELSMDVTSRTAVATLDEARSLAFRTMVDHWPDKRVGEGPDWHRFAGGTIGPLPDGTVIEVRRVSGPELATLVGRGDTVPALIAAFNAAQ